MNNKLQNILDIILEGSADITVVDVMNTVVASSDAQNTVGELYSDLVLLYDAGDALLKKSSDSSFVYSAKGKSIAKFNYNDQGYFVVFGENTDRALINLFLLYFKENGLNEHEVGSVSGMFYEILTGSLNVSATIERADKLGVDFLTRCIPVLVSTGADNHEVSMAIDQFIDSVEDDCHKITLSSSVIVLIYINMSMDEIHEEAVALLDMIESECAERCVIGIGRQSNNIYEIADIYNELKLAVKVDSLFDAGRHIVNLEEYNLGRMIRELDENTCTRFLDEVMGDFREEYEKDDYYETINTFFKCNLNTSEAAREMFIHRNTLIYRLGKIEKMTGYDIANFDDAFVFKWATMLHKYLRLKDSENETSVNEANE